MARWSLPSPSCLLEGHLVRGELVRQLGWQDSERDKVLVRQKSPELTEEQREVNLQRTGLQGCKLREACLVLRSPSGWKQHIGLRCCAPLRGCRCLHGVASFLTDRAPLRGSRPSSESRGQHTGGLDNQAPAQHSLP